MIDYYLYKIDLFKKAKKKKTRKEKISEYFNVLYFEKKAVQYLNIVIKCVYIHINIVFRTLIDHIIIRYDSGTSHNQCEKIY